MCCRSLKILVVLTAIYTVNVWALQTGQTCVISGSSEHFWCAPTRSPVSSTSLPRCFGLELAPNGGTGSCGWISGPSPCNSSEWEIRNDTNRRFVVNSLGCSPPNDVVPTLFLRNCPSGQHKHGSHSECHDESQSHSGGSSSGESGGGSSSGESGGGSSSGESGGGSSSGESGGGSSSGESGGGSSGGSSSGSSNRPPTVTNDISDLILRTHSSIDIDTDSHFADPDSSSLSFSVESDDPSVAEVSVEDSIITITALGLGTTTITITAEDSRGADVSESFEVTVRESTSEELHSSTIPVEFNYDHVIEMDTMVRPHTEEHQFKPEGSGQYKIGAIKEGKYVSFSHWSKILSEATRLALSLSDKYSRSIRSYCAKLRDKEDRGKVMLYYPSSGYWALFDIQSVKLSNNNRRCVLGVSYEYGLNTGMDLAIPLDDAYPDEKYPVEFRFSEANSNSSFPTILLPEGFKHTIEGDTMMPPQTSEQRFSPEMPGQYRIGTMKNDKYMSFTSWSDILNEGSILALSLSDKYNNSILSYCLELRDGDADHGQVMLHYPLSKLWAIFDITSVRLSNNEKRCVLGISLGYGISTGIEFNFPLDEKYPAEFKFSIVPPWE